MKNQRLKMIGDNNRNSNYNPDLAERINRETEEQERRDELERKRKPKPEKTIITPSIADYNGFEYVPSIGLYVAKEKELFNSDWNEMQETLHARGDRMPTIYEEVEFINHLRSKNDDESRRILDEIYLVQGSWRAEYLDARFEVSEGNTRMHYHVFTDSGIEQRSIDLKKVLMEDKTPGINLESWLADNEYGLPTQGIPNGEMYFWHPRNDNVAWLSANSVRFSLYCNGYPSYRNASLGVRAVRRQRAQNL